MNYHTKNFQWAFNGVDSTIIKTNATFPYFTQVLQNNLLTYLKQSTILFTLLQFYEPTKSQKPHQKKMIDQTFFFFELGSKQNKLRDILDHVGVCCVKVWQGQRESPGVFIHHKLYEERSNFEPNQLAQEVCDTATRSHSALYILDNYKMQMNILNNQVERIFENLKPYFVL